MIDLETLRGGLVVSCQAYPGEALRVSDVTARMARAVVEGGARAVRVQGIDDVEAVVGSVTVPVVGLWKDGDEGVLITPTLRHARAVAAAGAHVVALDGTRRPRPDGLTLAETISRLKAEHPVLVMADCGSLDDAVAAERAGADIVGTTLAGYTGERVRTTGPDLELVREVVAACAAPVMAEGRIHEPAQAAAALGAGAFAVCVGTAITHPTTITGWFRDAMEADA